MAVVHAKEGPQANIAPHDPLTLVIPGDPRHPVDTKDPHRTLDLNDHIINFLNEHPVEDVPVAHKWTPPDSELVYDSKGVAIANPQDEKDKAARLATEKKVLRPLTAADVLASQPLQDQFNAYMKAHGQTVQIHCGDHVIYPERHDAVRGEDAKGILEAFHLFKTAYEAKGFLPAQRDAVPTPAESCAFLIRNHECKIPPANSKKHLPDFPLTAPWPLMTIMADDNQSLREPRRYLGTLPRQRRTAALRRIHRRHRPAI